MQKNTIMVDGKEIKESDMPANCFMIQGKWYTEKGLPKELEAYKCLWADVKNTKQLETQKVINKNGEEKSKKNTILTDEQTSSMEDAEPVKLTNY